MAVGLGSMDMPVPAVAEWEWLNWKFPRAAHAGDTIFARWTLTQKRAPVGDSPTAIVVYRVDVHTAGGALCAEGEVGASVLRKAAVAKTPAHAEDAMAPGAPSGAPAAAPAAAPPAARRSRRRRRPAADGAKSPAEPKAVVAVEAPVVASPVPVSERTSGGPRRRRRRRSPGTAQARNGDGSASGGSTEAPPPAPAVAAAAANQALASAGSANPLTRAIRRLRRP
jgi:hypothetical protein